MSMNVFKTVFVGVPYRPSSKPHFEKPLKTPPSSENNSSKLVVFILSPELPLKV